MNRERDYPSLKQNHRVCNCAACGRLLIALADLDEAHPRARRFLPPPVCQRIRGRPYCFGCVAFAVQEQRGIA